MFADLNWFCLQTPWPYPNGNNGGASEFIMRLRQNAAQVLKRDTRRTLASCLTHWVIAGTVHPWWFCFGFCDFVESLFWGGCLAHKTSSTCCCHCYMLPAFGDSIILVRLMSLTIVNMSMYTIGELNVNWWLDLGQRELTPRWWWRWWRWWWWRWWWWCWLWWWWRWWWWWWWR